MILDVRKPHLLTLSERRSIFAYLRQRWPAQEQGWWHPIDACLGSAVLLVQSAWFQHDVDPRAFAERAGMRADRVAWRLTEGTPRWEDDPPDPPLGQDELLDLTEVPLDLGWQETIWVQPALAWLIYTGHDENTYFVGPRLVRAIKEVWPDWEARRWTSPFYDRPRRAG